MRLSRLFPVLAVLFAFLVALPATAAADERGDVGLLAPAPLGGGSPLNTSSGGRCTAGFAATRGSTGFLIAGPACGRVGETIFSGSIVVGVVVGSQFPSSGATVIQVTNTTDWVLVPWVNTGGGRVVITGSTEAPVGASVCLLGSTTGWHCGTIVAKNQTVSFPEGVITGLTRTTVCAEPGDTGGPFISGSQAQGVLVGGSGNCSSGGTTFFQPINPILAAFGLTLLTG